MKRCFNCMEEIDESLSVCSVCGADLTTAVPDDDQLPPGSILKDRYYIGKSLGRGGFGITYLAFDTLLARKVAIKEYIPSGMASRLPEQKDITCSTVTKDSFLHGVDQTIEESRKLAGFSNLESVVTVFDSFKANGTAYIVMEYLTGMTVKEYVRKNGKLSYSDAKAIITPVLKTLDRVHRSGLIHRDISPDNIFLCDDEDRRVKLLDFGAAKLTESLDEKSRTIVLKQGYAPIEQYSSTARQGTWTDVYAIAATLYFMLSGQVPISAADRSADDRLPDISTFCHEMPSDAALALMKSLAVRSSDRPQTVRTLIDALSETTKEMPADDDSTMLLSKEEQALMERWMLCAGDAEQFTEDEKQILRKIGVLKDASPVTPKPAFISEPTKPEKIAPVAPTSAKPAAPASARPAAPVFTGKENKTAIPEEKSIKSEPVFENKGISSSKTKAANNGLIKIIVAAVLVVSLIAAAVALIPKISKKPRQEDNNITDTTEELTTLASTVAEIISELTTKEPETETTEAETTETETLSTTKETTTELKIISKAYIKTKNSDSKVNLRESPNEKSKSLGTFASGTEIGIIEKSGDWYKATVNGKTGFIKSDYVSDKKPVAFSEGYAKSGVYYNEWANIKCKYLNAGNTTDILEYNPDELGKVMFSTQDQDDNLNIIIGYKKSSIENSINPYDRLEGEPFYGNIAGRRCACYDYKTTGSLLNYYYGRDCYFQIDDYTVIIRLLSKNDKSTLDVLQNMIQEIE